MQVDYDQVAPTYNRRYQANPLPDVAKTLRGLVEDFAARDILEVGCGTGRWLEELQDITTHIIGLDRSPGMLTQAQLRRGCFGLVCGTSRDLPFPSNSFDWIYLVHAFHHFEQKEAFIHSAFRCLRPDGALSILGMDPHSGHDRYYLYDYFETTFQTDLERFPSAATIRDWMQSAGFHQIQAGLAGKIDETFIGKDIWQDPFLEKNATSQLTLLSDERYRAGLERIRQALLLADREGRELVFRADIEITMMTGRK